MRAGSRGRSVMRFRGWAAGRINHNDSRHERRVNSIIIVSGRVTRHRPSRIFYRFDDDNIICSIIIIVILIRRTRRSLRICTRLQRVLWFRVSAVIRPPQKKKSEFQIPQQYILFLRYRLRFSRFHSNDSMIIFYFFKSKPVVNQNLQCSTLRFPCVISWLF